MLSNNRESYLKISKSSAKIRQDKYLMGSCILLIQIIQKRGPTVLSCGIPKVGKKNHVLKKSVLLKDENNYASTRQGKSVAHGYR